MGFDLLLETLLEQKRAFNKKTVKKKTWIDIKVTFVMHIITEVKHSGEIWVFVYSAVKYTVTGCDRLFSFSICCCSDILIRRSHGWTCRLDLVSTHTQTLTTHTHTSHITKINTLYPHITAIRQHIQPHQWAHPDSESKSAIPTDSNLAFQVSVWHQGWQGGTAGDLWVSTLPGGHVPTSCLPGFKAASHLVWWKMLHFAHCHFYWALWELLCLLTLYDFSLWPCQHEWEVCMVVDDYLFVWRYLEQRKCSEMHLDERGGGWCTLEGRPATRNPPWDPRYLS